MKRIACLGATKGMGRALSRLLAQRGDAVFCSAVMGRISRQAPRISRFAVVAAPRLATRSATRRAGDVCRGAGRGGAGSGWSRRSCGHGRCIRPSRKLLEGDPALAARLLQLNFAHTVLFCEEARRRLLAPDRPQAQRGGTLCVFSSVAGEMAGNRWCSTAPAKPACRDISRDWITSSAGRA